MTPEIDFHTAKALLEWQMELGADEAIDDAPVNRYEAQTQPAKGFAPMASPLVSSGESVAAKAAAPAPGPVPKAPETDFTAEAEALAAQATSLEELAKIQAGFDHCQLKRGARSFVFADGQPGAKVMIIGEAPGRDEDMQGKPFVGRAGQLLDKMLAAIDMGRNHDDAPVYITNILPWRPPQNRDPDPQEMAMMLPFVRRHVELAAPDVLVLMGNISCHALLGRRGITRLRGNWTRALDKPALPMFHPAYLLRNPHAKRDAWHDLLMLQAKLKESQS
ncbi:MAG: uracil-DNA glycosylase [Brevirhabdus sp.]